MCGGVFYPGEADCVPDQFVKQLANRLPDQDVQILDQTTVNGYTVQGLSLIHI